MRNDSVETFEVKGLTVRIQYDTDPASPLEWARMVVQEQWENSKYSNDSRKSPAVA